MTDHDENDEDSDDLYVRLNKKGDGELINGDEETINELVNDIDESLINAPNKYIADYSDNENYGITRESFTGTSNIATCQTPYITYPQSFDENEEDEDDNETNRFKNNKDQNLTLENTMGRETLIEWLPEFEAGDYNPGDPQMPSPGGKGVSDRTPTRSKVGRYDTDMSDEGDAWPRKHKETPAMCDVSDDGVEHKSQGGHKSSVGKPDDGIQSEIGHNWPDEPTNSGNGVAEPLEGERWSDGGVLKNGSGQNEFDNKGHSFGLPKDGPITGTKGNQLGQPSEAWNPSAIGNMMSEDYNLQDLFDNYAKNTDQVCLEGFQSLCDAHGIDVFLDETSMLRLMDVNREFMFHEHRDSDGKYWLSEAVDSSVLNELQIRSPEQESTMYNDENRILDPEDEDTYGGDPHGAAFSSIDSPEYDDRLSNINTDSGQLECAGCGYTGFEEECPECGMPMSDEEGDDFDNFKSGQEFEPAFDDLSDPSMDRSSIDDSRRQESHFSPRMMESAQNFLVSARSIIEGSKNKKGIGEALSYSWSYHTNNADPSIFPVKVRKMLESIQKHYPNFTIDESDAIDPPDGVKIGSNGSNRELDSLPEQPGMDKFKKHGDANLLNHKQNNSLEGEPVITGTGKGLSEGVLKSNFQKLSRHIKAALAENAPAIRGKYKVQFEVAVLEGKAKSKKKNKTPKRNGLSEALADVEEILQFHNPNDVTLETSFVDSRGAVVFKHDVPLMTINTRGPVFAENKTLFRFRRNAEDFAQELVAEGVACRVSPHNWGCAVDGQFDQELAESAFATLTEKKKHWIQDAFKDVKKRGTEGVCTGDKFGSDSCPPGSKRYNMAKNLRKMNN